METRKIAAGFCLGLLIFGFVSETYINEHVKLQHESIKVQTTYLYRLNPISVSGTASMTSGQPV